MNKLNGFIRAFFGTLLLVALLAGCGGRVVRTSEELPFSVLVARYETEEIAEKAAGRLRKDDVPAYVVKKLEEGSNYAMDVHAGAFPTEEEAVALADIIKEKGVDPLSIAHFAEIEEAVASFEALPKESQQAYVIPDSELPDLSPAVEQTLRAFPVNEDFTVSFLAIRDTSVFPEGELADPSDYLREEYLPYDFYADDLEYGTEAFSQAVYEDPLYGHSVGILIFKADEEMRAEIMSAVADGDDLGMGTLMNEEESFKTKYGQLDGYAYREETDGDPVFGYIGAIDESDHVMIMRTDQCPEEIFFELAAGGSGKDGLLFFPEIRQNLYVLPNESDLDPKLGIYVLEQIGPEYAEERDNVEWAVPIVGNFCSAGSYDVDGALCDVAFFNVVHSDTAQSIHSIFVNDKQSRSVGEPRELENGHAAYLTSDWFSDELSFEHGSYIIAINADTEELSVESMKEIAMDLQIWG